MFKILGLVSLLVLAFSNAATAGKAFSWDLSRAMMKGITTNPQGSWAFMQNTSGIDNPANYTLLPKYHSPCFVETPWLNCWRQTDAKGSYPVIGVAIKTFAYRGITFSRGIPYLHPSVNVPVILRWKSPINGRVNIMGSVSAIDPNWGDGDGINWSLKNKNATIIKSGYLAQGQGSTFLAQNIGIKKGESLYFTVDDGQKGDRNNDSTNLDIFITSQQ
ncbi:hypothetical protein [Methylovulum sp.]|uniref:hypothetical protein n=1 Tax=Methylovulum sp. TaxID=1916980 RepID=UPI002632720D|nr:hypothetical protein [Methylovulum sp.]MDD5126226.1 hypothetical protein [Methylovulum sp.]